MILHVSGRTDIVAYYTDWFIKRLRAGYCFVRNPIYPTIVYRYDLRPQAIDAIIFCSKNYTPILKYLPKLLSSYNIVCHYTITAFEEDIEPNVPSIDVSIETLIKLSRLIGKERVIWRFDPILFTKKYSASYIIEKFAYILEKIAPYIQRIIFSFVEEYAKVKRNMPELITLSKEDKNALAKELSRLAKKHGIILQTCGMTEDYKSFGILPSGCTTPQILYEATKQSFQKKKGTPKRIGCTCLPTRDIGAYNTCPHACKYCYANLTPSSSLKTIQQHDVHSPIFLGKLLDSDTIKEAPSLTFLDKRMTLFDL